MTKQPIQISTVQIITLLTYNLENNPMSFSAIYQKYPRSGIKSSTIESLCRKGFLTLKQTEECKYYHKYSISLEGKIYLEDTFKKKPYYSAVMKAFQNRMVVRHA